MGQPAARVTDLHVCPMVTGIVPHVGGPILPPCKINVLTGKLPQARVTDMATCVGPPDMIATGAPNVLVGGLPAARMGDTTVHGGKIVFGLFTVLIGTSGGGGGGAGGNGGSVGAASGASQTGPMLSAAAATIAPHRQAIAYKNAAKAGTPFCARCN